MGTKPKEKGKDKVKRLKLKKETIKDLDAGDKAAKAKGGVAPRTYRNDCTL